ncbi:MAG: hypothetical protein LDL11_08040 [Desulfarculus sp.]|nr:hypothetical protein [Desulfarculus sp.]
MSITVKYQGLKDQPLLVTPTGRHPSTRELEPTPRLTASGIYFSGEASQLPLSLRQAEQDRVMDEVRRRVDSLARAIDRLPIPKGDLPGVEVTALSDQPEAVAAVATTAATSPAWHGVQARWPAQVQTILTAPQNPIALTDLPDGVHTFNLTIDGETHLVEVRVNNGGGGPADDQEELLNRLARAINGVDSRVLATVEEVGRDYGGIAAGSRLGRGLRLRVEGVGAGQGVDFSLEDVDGSLVETYGLNRSIAGRPARVSLGGALVDLAEGQTSLDQGQVGLRILDASDGEATISVETGAGPITRALRDVIGQYNELVGYLDLQADLLRPSLKDRITRPTENLARALDQLDLRASPQGRIKELAGFATQVAANYETTFATLLGPTGWATTLREKLRQIQAMDKDAFAAELVEVSPREQRRRALMALEQVRASIVEGYY